MQETSFENHLGGLQTLESGQETMPRRALDTLGLGIPQEYLNIDLNKCALNIWVYATHMLRGRQRPQERRTSCF